MSTPQPRFGHGYRAPTTGPGYGSMPTGDSGSLADILERVLDRGVVIAGDIRVNLLDIELLTIKLRLVVASVDTARQMGIDWWEHDPFLAGRPHGTPSTPSVGPSSTESAPARRARLARDVDGPEDDPDRPEREMEEDR